MEPKPRRLDAPFFRFVEAHINRPRSAGYTQDMECARKLAEDLRNFDCVYYGRCLGVAACGNWPGWACDRCPRFHVAANDPQNVLPEEEDA